MRIQEGIPFSVQATLTVIQATTSSIVHFEGTTLSVDNDVHTAFNIAVVGEEGRDDDVGDALPLSVGTSFDKCTDDSRSLPR
jgi:hypothetical protein